MALVLEALALAGHPPAAIGIGGINLTIGLTKTPARFAITKIARRVRRIQDRNQLVDDVFNAAIKLDKNSTFAMEALKEIDEDFEDHKGVLEDLNKENRDVYRRRLYKSIERIS